MRARILLSTIVLASVSATTAGAETMEFSYNAFGESSEWFGYKKAETYDVGVRIADSALTGKKITGFTVQINGTSENISGCRGWLSNELKAETVDKTSQFTPDIASVEGTFSDGNLTVTFTEPYVIPEEGVFLGYSYDVDPTNATQTKTVAVVDGSDQGGFWFHSSTTQKTWADMAKRNGIVSAICVTLEGDFMEDCAVPVFAETPRIAENDIYNLPVTITSYGLEGVSSVGYTYEIGKVKGEGTYVFPERVAPAYGRKGYAIIELDPIEGLGEQELTVTFTKINGQPNEASDASASTPAIVQKFVPVNRPLVEEYTGLHCGYCPRGYVMMEQMKEKFGDRFVALSYHSGGWESNAMDCIKDADFPAKPGGYPAATLNRGQVVDPSNIPALWEKSCRNMTQAEVQVDWLWADEAHTVLKATARTRFLKDMEESDYKLAFVMLADGLSNPKWAQSNYYSNTAPVDEYSGPFWDLFIGQPDHVMGLTFNDIVVYATDYRGVEESLPAQIVSGEWYEYSVEINTEDIVNLDGTHIVDNFDLTRMVAIIVSGEGRSPLNCISSTYPSNGTGTAELKSYATPESTIYYDLQGRRIDNPANGIFIKVETMADGSLKTTKTIK